MHNYEKFTLLNEKVRVDLTSIGRLALKVLILEDLDLHTDILAGMNAILIMDHPAAAPGFDVHPVRGYVIRNEFLFLRLA